MRRITWYLTIGASLILPIVLLLVAGCGGGGGPLSQAETGPAPSISAAFLQLLPVAQRAATTVGADKCANSGCHSTASHANYTASWQKTRHAQVNVTCESCHGPGSAHLANPTKTNILNGTDSTRPEVCGQCHGPTYDQFKNSRHASAVQDVVNEGQSNPKTYVATCFRCHSAAFRAAMVDDPLANGKTPDDVNNNITAQTVDQLQAFVPGTKESATCVTCHDPHRATTNLTSTGEQAYLRRPTSNDDITDVTAATPVKQYTAANHICGSCHNGRGVNPSDAALTSGTSRANMHYGPQYNMLNGNGGVEGIGTPPSRTSSHAEAPDQCAHCHMPNKRHTFTVSLDTSCAPCHTPTDAASRSDAIKNETLSGLLGLRTRMERWANGKFADSDLWDYSSYVSAEGKTAPNQSLIPIELKRARHNYYFILNDNSYGIHNTPYMRYLLNVANAQLDTLGVSRDVSGSRAVTPQQRLTLLNADRLRSRKADGIHGH